MSEGLNTTHSSKKVLCLHGFRTSGKILKMQMAAMQYHVPVQYHFISGPFPATGPPDSGIQKFYPNEVYHEWYSLQSNESMLNDSLEFIIMYLKKHGPFHTLLGFSQGGAIATQLAYLQQIKDDRFDNAHLFSSLIVIGGVPPPLSIEEKIKLPSLHILSPADPFYERSLRLLADYFSNDSTATLYHDEGHKIPSIRTELYPKICLWLDQTFMQLDIKCGANT